MNLLHAIVQFFHPAGNTIAREQLNRAQAIKDRRLALLEARRVELDVMVQQALGGGRGRPTDAPNGV